MRGLARGVALLVGCAGWTAAPLAAQDGSAFVVRLGSDTVSVERYRRVANRIEGRQVVRTPRTTIRDYVAYLNPDGTMARFEVRWQRPGAPAHARAAVDFQRDGASVQLEQEGRVESWRVAAPPGSIPLLGSALGIYEPALTRFRRSRRAELEAGMVPIGGTELLPLSLRRLRGDSVRVTTFTGQNHLAADTSGALLGWNGLPSNFKITAERVDRLDLESVAAAFAAREQQGQTMGILSPPDSVKTRLGGAALSISYSRPSRRGREIFGGIVPWNQVWRTGANQATQLTTDRDLIIGGTRVPAGSYSLFSIPSPTRWTLIVNRQTGQPGTEHHPEQDLARIPMTREPLAQPVEQFTIAVEPDGGKGRLVLLWDDTRVWVPIEVR